MNKTMDDEIEKITSHWLLDLSYRILSHEQKFPELAYRIEKPEVSFSLFNPLFWKSLLEDIGLVIYCLPEVQLIAFLYTFVLRSCFRPDKEDEFWEKIRDAMRLFAAGSKVSLREAICGFHGMKKLLIQYAHPDSTAALIAFGKISAELNLSKSGCDSDHARRLDALICQLETLKNSDLEHDHQNEGCNQRPEHESSRVST